MKSLKINIGNQSLFCQVHAGEEGEAVNAPLLPPPPLLLAVSDLLVPRPGYWPESVQLVGFLASSHCEARRLGAVRGALIGAASFGKVLLVLPAVSEHQLRLTKDLTSFSHLGLQMLCAVRCGSTRFRPARFCSRKCLATAVSRCLTKFSVACYCETPELSQVCSPDVTDAADAVLRQLDDGPIVCVDMGSAARMGLLPSPARFVAILARALEAAGCCGVVLTGGCTPLGGARKPVDRSALAAAPNHTHQPYRKAACKLSHPKRGMWSSDVLPILHAFYAVILSAVIALSDRCASHHTQTLSRLWTARMWRRSAGRCRMRSSCPAAPRCCTPAARARSPRRCWRASRRSSARCTSTSPRG